MASNDGTYCHKEKMSCETDIEKGPKTDQCTAAAASLSPSFTSSKVSSNDEDIIYNLDDPSPNAGDSIGDADEHLAPSCSKQQEQEDNMDTSTANNTTSFPTNVMNPSPSNDSGKLRSNSRKTSSNGTGIPKTVRQRKRGLIHRVLHSAFVKSRPFEIDYTQVSYVPAARTAFILIVEWCVLGIGNPTSSAFQLGCLYTGFSDPNHNLGYRVRAMGLTVISCTLFGSLLPALLWNQSVYVTVVCAFFLAYIAGYSPMLGSPILALSLKLSTALFAIQLGLNRNTQGGASFADPDDAERWTYLDSIRLYVVYTLIGCASSFLLAILPELIGTRDAVRTDLFKAWYGFGMDLMTWNSTWGTMSHLHKAPMPTVTLSITKTTATIGSDTAEEVDAKHWLLSIMKSADTIRASVLSLSNLYRLAKSSQCYDDGDSKNSDDEYEHTVKADPVIEDFYFAIGNACRGFAFAMQFPWMCKFVPSLRRMLIDRSVQSVQESFVALRRDLWSNNLSFRSISSTRSCPNEQETPIQQEVEFCIGRDCILSLVDVIQSELDFVANQLNGAIICGSGYSPITSIPKRLASAFGKPNPVRVIEGNEDGSHQAAIIRGYALRYAIAYALANIPGCFIPNTAAHWFPMTVALIMGPTHSATFGRVAHRTIGTLLGIGLGCALYPLFEWPEVLIVLLGLNTYAVAIFFPSNYALFTFFVTGWVYTTVVGTGGGSISWTTLYRFGWTLAAAALVLAIVYTFPPRINNNIGNSLVAMARAVKGYAQATVREYTLQCRVQNGEIVDESLLAAIKEARENVVKVRESVIKARVAMLERINQAVLTPMEGTLVEPKALVASLASDLIDADIVPQTISLVTAKGGRADDLIIGIDEDAYKEIDNLIARIEQSENFAPCITGSNFESTESSMAYLFTGRGPFAASIARAHHRLDQVGIPRVGAQTGK